MIEDVVDELTDAVAGPLGYLPVLAVLGLLVTREFVRTARPGALSRRNSAGAVLTYCAGVVAFGVLALRFLGFS